MIDGWTVAFPGTRAERRRGLLGRDRIGKREALVLAHCRSVHTLGMRTPIDVLVMDRHWRVRRIATLPPGRAPLPSPRARHIVEVAAGRGPAFCRSLVTQPLGMPWRTTPRKRTTTP